MNRPQPNEYPVWGETYISKVDMDIFETLEEQIFSIPVLFESNKAKENFAYAEGKWTLKEMLGHIIDTERILTYRLTCFARNEKQHLPGFDEDDYVTNAHFNDRSIFSLAEEFAQLRKANMFLIKSLNETDLNRIGNANGNNMSVKALVYVLAGHIIHHTNVIKERYL